MEPVDEVRIALMKMAQHDLEAELASLPANAFGTPQVPVSPTDPAVMARAEFMYRRGIVWMNERVQTFSDRNAAHGSGDPTVTPPGGGPGAGGPNPLPSILATATPALLTAIQAAAQAAPASAASTAVLGMLTKLVAATPAAKASAATATATAPAAPASPAPVQTLS